MSPFGRLDGIAAPLPQDNVDTDAIIPSRESQSVSRSGYGERLFANWRYQPGTRTEQPEFVLNREPFRHAQILVAGHNFGCGSSREAAVWSLAQFGIRCVIASSFGAIFRGNCVRNGVLPVTLSPEGLAALHDAVRRRPGSPVRVDLQACRVIDAEGGEHSFEIDALEREMLLAGLDEIGLTLRQRAVIAAFQQRDRESRPWIWNRRDAKRRMETS
ncbi:MAG: 3-isopropylmalate dehydratase small subunit [Burkholderiaceae bacterium]